MERRLASRVLPGGLSPLPMGPGATILYRGIELPRVFEARHTSLSHLAFCSPTLRPQPSPCARIVSLGYLGGNDLKYLSLQSMHPLVGITPIYNVSILSLSLSIVLVLPIPCPSNQALSLQVTTARHRGGSGSVEHAIQLGEGY